MLVEVVADALELRADAVLQAWKRHSYIVIELPDKVHQVANDAIQKAEAFVDKPLVDKERCRSKLSQYLGYKHNPDFEKELFQVITRCWGTQEWPGLVTRQHYSYHFYEFILGVEARSFLLLRLSIG